MKSKTIKVKTQEESFFVTELILQKMKLLSNHLEELKKVDLPIKHNKEYEPLTPELKITIKQLDFLNRMSGKDRESYIHKLLIRQSKKVSAYIDK